MYIGCQGALWLSVVTSLKGKYNINPCYWCSIDSEKENIIMNFDRCIFHDSYKAMRGIEALGNHDYFILDEKILKDLKYNESIALNMMNRMDTGMDDGNEFTYSDRLKHYYKLLSYWLGVINYYKPDLVIIPNIPHIYQENLYNYFLPC